MKTIIKFCIALAVVLVALQWSAAEKPGTSISQHIPLLPSGIHLGMSEEEFVRQRPSAVMFGGFLPKQKSEEVKERARTMYIESEMGGQQRSAVTYQFDEGLCSVISFEAYFPGIDYNVTRGNILDAFLKKYGASPQRCILHTEEPAETPKRPYSKRGSPTLEWKKGDEYILLTVTPDEWVSDDGIGKIGLKVVDKKYRSRLDLSNIESGGDDIRFSSIDTAEKRLENVSK